MKLEIVISAYNEKLKWIPIDWHSKCLIYRCGEPISTHNEKLLRQISQISQFTSFNQHDTFAQDIQKVKVILDLIAEYSNLFNKSQNNNTYVEKNTLNCPNGREAEQWLNHIIWRYDNLADITVFLQGHPQDHCSNFIDIINKLSEIDIKDFSFSTIPHTSTIIDFNKENMEEDYLLCEKFLQKIPKKVSKISWNAGAQFAITKSNIHRHAQDWYERLQYICKRPRRREEIMERLWWTIFDCPQLAVIN